MLGIKGADAVAIGDTSGFTEASLRQAGCVQVYPGPAAILACFGTRCSRGRQWMARKLKTYQTSLGFFDEAIAAPSTKAARRQQSLPPGCG